MPDPNVSFGENTPEFVAYLLMEDIASAEKKGLRVEGGKTTKPLADRKWILDTYAECRTAVVGGRSNT